GTMGAIDRPNQTHASVSSRSQVGGDSCAAANSVHQDQMGSLPNDSRQSPPTPLPGDPIMKARAYTLTMFAVLLAVNPVDAQTVAGKWKANKVIPVWPGAAPGSEGWKQKEVEYRNDWDHRATVRNVTAPTLTAFLPDPSTATGAAVVIC